MIIMHIVSGRPYRKDCSSNPL